MQEYYLRGKNTILMFGVPSNSNPKSSQGSDYVWLLSPHLGKDYLSLVGLHSAFTNWSFVHLVRIVPLKFSYFKFLCALSSSMALGRSWGFLRNKAISHPCVWYMDGSPPLKAKCNTFHETGVTDILASQRKVINQFMGSGKTFQTSVGSLQIGDWWQSVSN